MACIDGNSDSHLRASGCEGEQQVVLRLMSTHGSPLRIEDGLVRGLADFVPFHLVHQWMRHRQEHDSLHVGVVHVSPARGWVCSLPEVV